VLERSQAVEPGVGTMLYLAECYEKIGRTASAWAMYREAASAAQAQGQSDRARVGAVRAEHLGPSLSKIIVDVPPNVRVSGLVITRNGSVVPSAAYGIALPVDPGVQQLTAAAPGYESWTHSMELPSNGARVSVEVPALTALPASPAPEPTAQGATPPPAIAVSPASAALSTPVEAPAPRHTFHKPLAFALGGAGLVAIAVGSYFGVKAIDDNSEANKLCPNEVCVNQQGRDYDAAAHRAATAANVLVFGGLALASAGVIIFLTRPGEDDDRLQVGLATSPGMAQLSLRGGF
jgi:serine/threonine-protein kinase